MCESMKRTVRVILGAGIVMAALLVAQPAQAHETALRSPTCSRLPTAEGFYAAEETAAIIPTTPAPTGLVPKVGTGTAANGGYDYLRYAKITVPQLAAGELRVFDSTGTHVSDAVLCKGTRAYVTSRTSYSAHNAANTAASRASTASTASSEAGANVSTARNALSRAASALDSAARALTAIGKDTDATRASGAATTARDALGDTSKTAAGDFTGDLSTAAGALGTARDAFHARFQIRAEVNPGDEEYVLVVATDAADATDLTPAVQFHGALAATTTQRQRRLNAADEHTYTITVTTPGLLTVETTGSTDTSGMLSGTVTAEDDSSGSGNNFKIVAPVDDGSYTVTVDGQTATTTGSYTLDMDFKVAMQPTAGVTLPTAGVTVPVAEDWGTGDAVAIAADDDTLQIQGRDDEDYFLLSIAADSSGFLTIEATDDTTAMTDAATTGTFYGPTGEITTDTNSGADSSHFRIRAPVEEGMEYLVKVTGTTGRYLLTVTLDLTEGGGLLTVPGAQNRPSNNFDCSVDDPGEICPPSGESLERERYVFNVTESGALDVRTTGSIDTVGTLYGPAGNRINDPDADDNRGDGNNFRISASVGPGLHLVEVRGKTRTTTGVFDLIVNFVPGAEPVDPTDPPDPPDTTDPPDQTIEPDATGALDEPPPNSARSGIGTIRGWACQDDGTGVQIRIMDSDGDRVATFTAPYGSDRGDVDISEHCDRRLDGIGFAVQFNYNLLDAGTYTIQAFVGGERVGLTPGGQTNTFRVVRISNQPFLQRVQSSRIRVENFPFTGDTTILEWDQQSQNFQIVDHE